MKKKVLSVLLAGALAASFMATTALTAGAVKTEHSKYVPGSDVPTYKYYFAMPGSWLNDSTKDNNDAAGCYWWDATDSPGDRFDNGWPGYECDKETGEAEVPNLFSIRAPQDATTILWNNYLDGGMERDPAKNPFYDAAAQTRDFPGQYYSRTDDHETYDILFKYIYMKSFEKAGVEGIDKLDIKSDNFWVEANKLCAKYNGEDYDKLSADEKTFQVDLVLDDNTPDLSEFGAYASNFFNEDLVKAPEESQGFGQSFTFDNMVFVVNFDPNKMVASPQSGKIGYDGDFYFYYGGGEYGSWPTKELNEKMGGVSGNFTQGNYVDPNYKPPTPTVDPAPTTIPSPSGTDAKSSTNDSDNNSNTNNNGNGAIATGQFSVAVIALVVLFAGVAIVMFARKKEQD